MDPQTYNSVLHEIQDQPPVFNDVPMRMVSILDSFAARCEELEKQMDNAIARSENREAEHNEYVPDEDPLE